MENIDVEVSQRENRDLRIKIWFIRIGKRFWFIVKEVALALVYPNPKKTVDHIDSKDKKSIDELLGENYKRILKQSLNSKSKVFLDDLLQKLWGDQKLVNDLVLISFCTKSRKRNAVPFQRWVYKTMQKIKETGPCFKSLLTLITKIETLEKKIEASRVEVKKTCDKATQTLKSVVVLDGSFRDFEERIERSLKKTKLSFKKTIKEARLNLERSIEDLERSIRRSSSSSSSSYYSSE